MHELASNLIRQVTRRQEKAYIPRPADGEIIRCSNGTYNSPEYFILKSALEHLEDGKTVMFLSFCAYHAPSTGFVPRIMASTSALAMSERDLASAMFLNAFSRIAAISRCVVSETMGMGIFSRFST
jgi:hypothetical protein